MSSYTISEAARILGLSRERLRYWERTGLIRPSRKSDGSSRYGFRDLVCTRTVLVLLRSGIPLRRIRRNLEAIRDRLPETERPLGLLRIWVEGSDRVVVRYEGVLLEPDGQLVLDFRLEPSAPEEVASLPVAQAPGSDPQTALEWFERGCLLDSEPGREAAAIEAYRRCLEVDPDFADAYCNLGTLHQTQGRRNEARGCYEDALRCASEHVEAHYNLAVLLEEEGRDEAALRHYKAAMRSDPLYADVQLNLALLYERLGLPRRARDHWRRYVQLEPRGGWAEIARKHLEE